MDEPPFVLVIAGPSGSGKSTLTNYLVGAGIDFGEYINPDEIAAKLDLPEPQRSRQAQQFADFQRDRCLTRRISFSFETVMSHPSKIELMMQAALTARRTVLFDNSALVSYPNHRQLPSPKSGLRPVAVVMREGMHYDITLEADVPEWVVTHLVRPLSELATEREGMEVTVHQRDDLLG